MPVRVRIGEESAPAASVRRVADAGTMFAATGGLLDLGEIILRIAGELEHADLDQRVIPCAAILWKVEGVYQCLPNRSPALLDGNFHSKSSRSMDPNRSAGGSVLRDPLRGFGMSSLIPA